MGVGAQPVPGIGRDPDLLARPAHQEAGRGVGAFTRMMHGLTTERARPSGGPTARCHPQARSDTVLKELLERAEPEEPSAALAALEADPVVGGPRHGGPAPGAVRVFARHHQPIGMGPIVLYRIRRGRVRGPRTCPEDQVTADGSASSNSG